MCFPFFVSRSPSAFAIHASVTGVWDISRATPEGGPTLGDDVPLCPLWPRRGAGREGPHRLSAQSHFGAYSGEARTINTHAHKNMPPPLMILSFSTYNVWS